jgi:hypothetical protein
MRQNIKTRCETSMKLRIAGKQSTVAIKASRRVPIRVGAAEDGAPADRAPVPQAPMAAPADGRKPPPRPASHRRATSLDQSGCG